MANRWIHTNKLISVQATLVADDQETLYPSSNLNSQNYAQPWRTTDVSGAHDVVNDFGTAQTIGAIFLGNVNLTSSATVKIQGHTADSWGTPDIDETVTVSALGTDPAHRNLYHTLADSGPKRYWRIEITDAGNTDGYYEIGEWFLGEPVSLPAGQAFQTEKAEEFIRNNIRHETEWMNVYSFQRAERRILRNLMFMPQSETNKDEFIKLEQAVKGAHLPFVFVPDATASPPEAFFVRMDGDMEIAQTQPILWEVTMTLNEEAAGRIIPVVA